jgi:hypothetical protein
MTKFITGNVVLWSHFADMLKADFNDKQTEAEVGLLNFKVILK